MAVSQAVSLPLIRIEEFEILLEHEDMLRAVVTGEGGDNLRFGGMTLIGAMPGQLLRIAPPGHNVAEDAQAGDAGDVGHYQGQLHVHLDQRLLHPLDDRGVFSMRVARWRK